MTTAIARRRRRRGARRNPELALAGRRVHVPWWALIGGAVVAGGGAYLLFRGNGLSNVVPLNQGDGRWSHTPLGKSSEFTLGGAGCMVTSMTMAVNALTHDTLTPDIAQAAALGYDSNSFSGAGLNLPIAADALDCYAPESERLHDYQHASLDALRSRLDSALGKRGGALAHITKDSPSPPTAPPNFQSDGQHFILIYKRSGADYLAADPATGTVIKINRQTLQGRNPGWNKSYLVLGVAPIYKAA